MKVIQKLGNKLKEQGTQRGLLLLAPLVAVKVGVSVEDMITIVTAVLAIYGTHNVVTDG